MLEGIVVGDDATIGELQSLLVVLVEANAIWRDVNRINHHPLLSDHLCLHAGLTAEDLLKMEDKTAHIRVLPHHHELPRLVALVGSRVVRRGQNMDEIPQLTRVNSHDCTHTGIEEAVADDDRQAYQFVRIILLLLLNLLNLLLLAPIFVRVLPLYDLLQRDIRWQAGKLISVGEHRLPADCALLFYSE